MGIHSVHNRLDIAEKDFIESEYKVIGKMKQKNILKKSFSDMWDNIKWINMHVIKVPERDRKILEEIMAKFLQVW